VPEVARQIVARWGEIQVRDGRTGDLIQYTVSRDSSAIDLVTASSNARPDIRLLGTLNAFVPNLELGKLFAAEYDGSNPLFGPRTRAFGSNTQPLQAEAIPDADGDGWPQFAVLKQRADNGRDSVTLLDLRVEEDFLRFDDAAIQIGLGEQFTSQKLLVAPDLNANGASEVVVYEYETTGSRHRALINDGRTGARIGIVHFSEQLVGIDAAICPDINNNGAAEIALLGIRPADGGVRVLLKDLSTDELLGAASLPRLQ